MRLKYKKLIIMLTTGIMGIGMVTFSFSLQEKAAANDLDEKQPAVETSANITNEAGDLSTFAITSNDITTTPAVTLAPTATPVPKDELELNKYEDINQVVKSYYNAKLTCSEEDFKPIIMDVSVLDMERLQRKIEYIISYQNINCYTKKGVGDIDYVVYVRYDIELPSIDTLAPSIDRLLIKYVDGKPKIYLGEISNETGAKLKELENSEEVQILVSNVNKDLKEAREKDENLNEFYTSMAKTVSKSN